LPLLLALGFDDGKWPPFSACLALELYEVRCAAVGLRMRLVGKLVASGSPFCFNASLFLSFPLLQDKADKKERWVRIMYQNEPLEVLGANDGFIKFEKFAELINSLAPQDYAAACAPQASKPPAAGKAGTSF
jgi:hypothetical protein